MIVIGIDPGTAGGLAAVTTDERLAFYLKLADCQVDNFPSPVALVDHFEGIMAALGFTANDILAFVVEKVRAGGGETGGASKRRMGASSAFKFGAAWATALSLPAHYVKPLVQPMSSTWKKGLGHGLGPDKEKSRAFAHELWPEHAGTTFKFKNSADIAEAGLMGIWYLRVERGGQLASSHGTVDHDGVRRKFRIKRG